MSVRARGEVSLTAGGVTLTALPEGPVHVWQRGPALDVRLNGVALSSASAASVLAGANRAAIETAPGRFEIIQFAQAEMIGPETWRLSQLLRGQFGTEPWRGAASGARFVLLDRNMPLIAQGAAWRGIDTALLWGPAALPADDPAWVRRTVNYEADALRLRAPAHVKARRRDDGAIVLSWIRRSRSASAMWDATEPPLDDGAEAYRVEIFDGTALKRRIETTAPEALYTSSQQTEDWGAPAPSPLAVQVMQIGADTGAGQAAEALLNF